MTEIRTDPKTVAQEYRQLPPADKAVFRTILELAVILLKTQETVNEESKKNPA